MPLRDDLLKPIEGDNPSGANFRYAPVVEKIKEARREEDDAPQGDWKRERKTADYKLVIKLAGETLATKTKDLQLAAWLTEALLGQEGFAGLHEGLELIRGLLEKFWDTIYPEIDEDGDLELRAAPVEWVGTTLALLVRKTRITKGGYNILQYQESRKVGYDDPSATQDQMDARSAKIAEGKLAPEEFDKDFEATPTAIYEAWKADLDACLELLDSLQLLGEEKFGRQAPSFNTLKTAVEEVRHQIHLMLQGRNGGQASAAAEPAAADEPAAVDDGWGTPIAEPVVAVRAPKKRTVAGLDPEDLDDAAARLDAVARFLRQQDAYSPGPYLLLRGYRWGELRGYGESPDPSNLVPPSSEIRQNLRRLALEFNWGELLEAAEAAMAQPCGRAWMDLQRYVVRAAEESGYTAISQAIRSEVRALITDLPALPTWTLMDDTPTGNAETQAWLKEIAGPPPAAPAEPPSYSQESVAMEDETETVAEGEPAPPDPFDLAMNAARQGRASEAIHLLADEIPRQRSGRARFQRKLQLAQICMMTGHEALAQPILEELTAYIDAHKLEEWEASDVVAHPLVLLYRCLNGTENEVQIKQKLYARISRLDPMQALECAR